jgi:ubiquinone/menaquinone biosynthesis C-methylase UbiE
VERTLDKSEIPRVYGSKAWMYDVWAALTESRARERALALAAIRDGESVLEVAVGTGIAFAEVLGANPSGRNEGVDLTEAMLDRARARAARSGARQWRLRVGDAYRLDFGDAEFDVVLNAYMLDLLPLEDFPRVLGEFRRVLRAGGRLVVSSMARADHLGYRLWEWCFRTRPSLVGGCRGVALEAPLAAAGFEVRAVERVSQLGFPSEVVLAVRR